MKTQVNIGLEGAFKVDLYSGGKFVETTDWFNNFITPTGLFYPNIYPFVDCFRFLSLGSDGSTSNQGGCVTGAGGVPVSSQNGTTGLAVPINTFSTLQGTTQSGLYIGWQGYANGSDNSQSACGTILTEQGPRFYRAWTIPTGGVNYTMGGGGLTINEFMVSPSSGSDPTGKYAFSRVRRTVTIPNGYSAIISYQLSVNLQNTGLTYFGANTFTTGSADVSSSSEDLGLVSGWANLSGYYRHVYHGLNVINSAGAHDTPEYGCGMEPSLSDLSNYCFYLSPDNSHFDVSKTGNPSNETAAYAADGLMGLVYGINMTYVPTKTPADSDFYGPVPEAAGGMGGYPDSITTPSNIRIGKDGYFNLPAISNYSSGLDLGSFNYQTFYNASQFPVSYASPGYLQKNPNKVDYGQKAIFSTRIFKQPINMTSPLNTISGRTKTITRKTLFSPVSSLGYNSRFGSLVFASNLAPSSSNQAVYYPMVDTLFFDSSGRSLMPHYRLIQFVFDERGTGVADAYITISQSGTISNKGNINRFYSRKTFQGPYDSVDGNTTGFDINNALMQGSNIRTELTPLGNIVATPLSGSSNPLNTTGEAVYTVSQPNLIASGCSGWGMVYGIITDDNTYYNQPFDYGIVNHNVTGNSSLLSVTPAPNPSGAIYWPNTNLNSNRLVVNITGLKYYSNGGCFNGIDIALPSGSTYNAGGGAYNWATNPCRFCPPTGHIVHLENIGPTGYRLLPNFGFPNSNTTDIYSPIAGGSYPGLSFDNGVELYFSISWSSPCSDAINCL